MDERSTVATIAAKLGFAAAVLTHYLEATRPPGQPPEQRRRSRMSRAAKEAVRVWRKYRKLMRRLADLVEHFEEAVLKDLTTTRIRAYIGGRASRTDARYRADDPDAPTANEASAREDLRCLRKAVKLFAGEHALAWHPDVAVPKSGPGRTRWLRRPEVARMY